MSDTATEFGVLVFEADLLVAADAEGNVKISGASDDAGAFLLAIQADDLQRVREMYAAGESDEKMKSLRGREPLGQEIANRAAQVARRAIGAGVVTYSKREGRWVLDPLRIRNKLFGMPGF